MSNLTRIFQSVRASADPSVDRALAAALPTADSQAAKLIVLTVLERGHADALAALVQTYDRLDRSLQEKVLAHAGELDRAIRQACGTRKPPGAINAVKLIEASRASHLAYLLVELLIHGDRAVAGEAGRCLLELTREAAEGGVGGEGDGSASPRGAPRGRVGVRGELPVAVGSLKRALQVQSAVEEAVARFDRHTRPVVFRAMAMLSPRPMPQAWAACADPRHPASRALAAGLSDGDEPALDRLYLPALAHLPLRTEAMQGVGRMTGANRLNTLLAMSHLLGHGLIRTALAKSPVVGALLPRSTPSLQEDPPAARGAPRWIAALPLEPDEKLRQLTALASLPDELTRLAVLRRLIRYTESEHADAALASVARFCDDPSPWLARLAVRRLIACEWRGLPDRLPEMVNSPHPAVSELASRELARRGFDRLWRAWARLDHAKRLAAGRALLKLDRSFHRHLSAKLSQPDPAVRSQALAVIRTLGQAGWFEPALRVLSADKDPKVASAAVAALGEQVGSTPPGEAGAGPRRAAHAGFAGRADSHAASRVESESGADGGLEPDSVADSDPVADGERPAREETTRILVAGLAHPDPRVRANAVESLDQLGVSERSPQVEARLMEMARSDRNRPRANAIKSLMDRKPDEAIDLLLRMLEEDDPSHRVSALWVVEHRGLLQAARAVGRLASEDHDPRVKQRALRVVRRLIDELKAAS